MGSQLSQELYRFSPQQRSRIYENLYTIELTYGCSIGCDFCAFDAVIGVRGSIPSAVLDQISEEMAQMTYGTTIIDPKLIIQPRRLRLYDATEPLDYEDNGRNYFDVEALFASKGFDVPTSTAIPKGKEELAIIHLDQIGQISISHMNRERLRPYFERLGVAVYIDIHNYYRSIFGNRVFNESPIRDGQILVKGTVEETISELRKKDPNLPTKTRFYDLRTDGNRPHHEVQDPDTLVLWCGREGFPPRSGKIIDRDENGVWNYGRAFGLETPPYESSRGVLSNVSGVKITPEGVFNVLTVRPSEKCKTGRVIEKISPDDFHVLKLTRADNVPAHPKIQPWHYAE